MFSRFQISKLKYFFLSSLLMVIAIAVFFNINVNEGNINNVYADVNCLAETTSDYENSNQYVAKIYSETNGWIYYSTLESAISNSESYDIIVITQDCYITDYLIIDKDLTLVSNNNATIYIDEDLLKENKVNEDSIVTITSSLTLGYEQNTYQGLNLTMLYVDGQSQLASMSVLFRVSGIYAKLTTYKNCQVQNVKATHIFSGTNFYIYGGVFCDIERENYDYFNNALVIASRNLIIGENAKFNSISSSGALFMSEGNLEIYDGALFENNDAVEIFCLFGDCDLYIYGSTFRNNTCSRSLIYFSVLDDPNDSLTSQMHLMGGKSLNNETPYDVFITDTVKSSGNFINQESCIEIGQNCLFNKFYYKNSETNFNILITENLSENQYFIFDIYNATPYTETLGNNPILIFDKNITINLDKFQCENYNFVLGEQVDGLTYVYLEECATYEFKYVITQDNVVTQFYNSGDIITKIADPEIEGFTFMGWYKESSCINLYTFNTMPSDNVTVYAKLDAHEFLITSDAGENGTISPIGIIPITYNDNLTFTFIPNKGYIVDDIQVDGISLLGEDFANALNNGYTFSKVLNNHTIHVEFKVGTYKIVATAGENGDISPKGEINVEYDSDIKFTITSNTGYHIHYIQVDGEITSKNQGDEYILTTEVTFLNIRNNHTIHVEFAISSFSLTYKMNYDYEDIVQTYDYQSNINLIENPSRVGYQFKGWYNEQECLTEFDYTTMPANDVVVYAKWEINKYVISASAGENGKISPSGNVQVDFNKNQTFSFIPNEGYEVKKVLINGTALYGIELKNAIENGYEFYNVDTNNTIYVEFDLKTYSITYNLELYGLENITQDYYMGDNIKIPETPFYNYYHYFCGWYDDDALTSPYGFSIMPAQNLVVFGGFKLKNYNISIVINEQGMATPTQTTITFPDTAIFNIVPNIGYSISDIKIDDKSISNDELKSVNANDKLTFSIPNYGFQLNNNSTCEEHIIYVEVSPNLYKITFNQNYDSSDCIIKEFFTDSNIMLIENPSRVGYQFKGWYNEQECLTEFNLTAMPANDLIVYAKWEINKYVITASAGENGDISPKGETTLEYDSNIKFIIVPNIGYYINSIKIDNIYLADDELAEVITNGYEFKNIRNNHTIHAEFAISSFSLTYKMNYDYEDIVQTYDYQSNINLIENPSRVGYQFKGWYNEQECLTEFNLTTMPANDLMVYAKWEIIKYIISASAGENGKISPQGEITMEYGDNKKFVVTPNIGYHISSIKIDGIDLNGEDLSSAIKNGYNFSNITNNHSISVEFEINKYNIILVVEGNGKVYCDKSLIDITHGEDRVFKIETELDKYHVKIKINDMDIDSNNKEIKVDVYENLNIEVRFIEKSFFETGLGIIIILASILMIFISIPIIIKIKKNRLYKKFK